MKKIAIMLLAALMLFAFVACDNTTEEPTGPVVTYVHDGKTESLDYSYFTVGAKTGDVTVEGDALKLATGNGLYFGTYADGKSIAVEAGNTYKLTYDVDPSNLKTGKAWFVGYGVEGGATPAYDWMNSAVPAGTEKKTVAVNVAVTAASDGEFTFTVTGPLDNEAESFSGTGDYLLVCGGTDAFSIDADGYVLISNIKVEETATKTN